MKRSALHPPPGYFSAGCPSSKAALLFCLLLVVVLFSLFFLLQCLLCLFVLFDILALWPPTLQNQLPALLFVLFVLFLLFVVVLSGEPKQNQWRGLVDRKLVQAPPPPPAPPTPTPVILLLAVPRWLFCFVSFVVLDVVSDYVLFFLLYVKIKSR